MNLEENIRKDIVLIIIRIINIIIGILSNYIIKILTKLFGNLNIILKKTNLKYISVFVNKLLNLVFI